MDRDSHLCCGVSNVDLPKNGVAIICQDNACTFSAHSMSLGPIVITNRKVI